MSTKTTGKARRNGPVVAIEVGTEWLKVVRAAPAKGGLTVTALYLQKLGDSVIASDVLASALKKQKLSGARVIACLPRQMVNVRMLELPSTDPSEIADMVDLQSGKQTPYSREEIVSDYRIIGSGRQGYTRVMLAIVQRSVLRERFFVLEEAGLEASRMCISTEGVFNWYRSTFEADDGTALVVDVDSYFTDVLVVSGGAVVFTRSILQGADQLGADKSEAREKFAREVGHSLEICRGEVPGLKPERLVVSGAGVKIDGLADHLGEQLGLAAEVRDSLAVVKAKPEATVPEDPASAPVSLTALLGIALDPASLSFNLIPDSVRMRRNLVARARELTVLAALVMAVLVSASMVATLRFFFKKNHLDELRTELAKERPRAARVERMSQIVRLARRRQDTRFAAIRLLSEVQRRVPEDLYFDRMDLDVAGEQLSLSGTGGDQRDIRVLVNNLKQSPLFSDAQEEGRTTRDSLTGRWRFQITCTLEGRS